MGAGHYIKNTGTDVCRILIGFNNGHYQAIDLSEWLASNPNDLLETNFGIFAGTVNKLPQNKLFIVPK
jgi:oxalate decarboxylase